MRSLSVLVVLCSIAGAQVFNPATGHIYVLTPTGTNNISTARAAATAAGGYLVAINDAAENAFLQANFTGRLWIGLSDELVEGTFAWDSGEPLSFTNWCAGEPNNGGTGEDYVELLSLQGCWNDQPATGNGLVPRGVIELPFGPQYQLNQAAASVDFDAVTATLLAPASALRCGGAIVTANVASSLPALPFEIVASFAAPVGANMPGALTTAGGQIVNVDITMPLVFVFGGPAFLSTLYPGNFSIPLNVPPPPSTITTQMVILDPANSDGFSLSQAASLVSAGSSGSIPGPTADDSSIVLNLTAPPFCGFGVPLYGVTYTQLFVISNGRVMTTAADIDFSPTVAEALLDNPFLGAWCDLNPSIGGLITAVNTGTGVRINYAAVPYFGTTIANTFSLELDGTTGELQIQNLSGIAAHTAVMFLGVSRGNLGSTNVGAVNYSTGSGTTTNGTDMIYAFGAAGSLTPLLNLLRFIPNASVNYDWIVL